MARRPRHDENPPVLTAVMNRHLGALRLYSVEVYLEWCCKHGFAVTLDKGTRDRQAEVEAHDTAIASKLKRHSKQKNNPRQIIEAVFRGEMPASDVQRAALRDLCSHIERNRPPAKTFDSLLEFILWAESDTDFVFESFKYGSASLLAGAALFKVHSRKGQWLRPLTEWKKQSHNAERQFGSLLRHLFAKYPVPAFMDQAWSLESKASYAFRDWYIHIGAGKNIRTARTPIPLTKLMAHHFLEAPASYSIEHALRWGQIHGLDGDRPLARAVIGSRIGNQFQNDEFWVSVFRFFIANPMLDRAHFGPIADYLYAQKFERRDVMNAEGGMEVLPPPQPNLVMRGRTPDTLLAQVERWHRVLGQTRGFDNVHFQPSGFKPLEFKTGNKEDQSTWRFRELRSTSELVDEGKKMRHCVSTYARSCAAGRCSIWTMELHSRMGIDKRQTIEVAKSGEIVQCRGKLNRLPTVGELDMVRKWANHAGLTLAPYVMAKA
jgi:PcfJ-like protein